MLTFPKMGLTQRKQYFGSEISKSFKSFLQFYVDIIDTLGSFN